MPIDPASPTPLYQQIAEAVRAEIESGALAPGDALAPLREAAARWGVHLHTVRHAYTALAREGLLEQRRGPGGTRVAAGKGAAGVAGAGGAGGESAFVERVVDEARRRFGLTPGDLAARIGRAAPPTANTSAVWFIECSEHEAESHARELRERFGANARGLLLDDEREPPAGLLLATYFHYNDIRRRWPRLLPSVEFVRIGPDPRFQELLPEGTRRLVVCEFDTATAETVAADISVLLPTEVRVEARELRGDNDAPRRQKGAVYALPPRVWESFGARVRAREDVVELSYVIDPDEFERLGRLFSESD